MCSCRWPASCLLVWLLLQAVAWTATVAQPAQLSRASRHPLDHTSEPAKGRKLVQTYLQSSAFAGPDAQREYLIGASRQLLDHASELAEGRKLVQAYLNASTASTAATQQSTPASLRALTRGIVIPTGGAKHLANTWVNLQVLRKRLQCALPVELVHNGPEEVPDDKRKLFEGEFTNIRFVDASLVPIPSHHRQTKLESYVIKVHALYITSFDEVLMLDSDNMPLADPSSLFDTPAYQAFGNLHWPDFANDIGKPLDPNIFRLLGLRIPWRAETGFRAEESGQLLINKARHADVLEYLLFLNLHSHIIYDYMWGDKDSVRIAYALAGKEGLRQQVQWTPRMALADHDGGGKGGDAASRKLLVGVIQHDPDARLVLMHRVTPGAKFDPDRKPYMKVDYITTPAGPDEFWATEWQAESKWGGTHEWRPESVDVTTPLTACPGEPFKCDLVDGTAGLLGIPIAWFEDLQQTLHFSYQAFRSYRKRLPATVKTHVRARKHGTDGIVVPNR